MDKTTVTSIIRFLKSEIQAKGINITGIALFGSQLTGTSTADSDLDLIIISDYFADKNIIERGKITMDAELKVLDKFNVPLDILKMTPSEYERGIKNFFYQAKMM